MNTLLSFLLGGRFKYLNFYWSFVGKIRLEFGFGGNGLFSASQHLLFQFLGFPEDASFVKLFVSARKPCDWFFALVSHQKRP
jgi:hypothetical protein